MKYDKILRTIPDFCSNSLPSEVTALLESDPEFKREFEQMRTTQLLISLKKHEQPDEATALRISRGIRRLIAADHQPIETPRGLALLYPMVRYAVAASFLLMIGVHVYTLNSLPGVDSLSWEVERAAPSVEQALLAESSPLTTARPSFLVSSNIGPDQIRYGTIPSVPVGFEY